MATTSTPSVGGDLAAASADHVRAAYLLQRTTFTAARSGPAARGEFR